MKGQTRITITNFGNSKQKEQYKFYLNLKLINLYQTKTVSILN